MMDILLRGSRVCALDYSLCAAPRKDVCRWTTEGAFVKDDKYSTALENE